VTTTGCDECDRNGPYLPIEGWWHDIHCARHNNGRALTELARALPGAAWLGAHLLPLVVAYVLALLVAIAIWGR